LQRKKPIKRKRRKNIIGAASKKKSKIVKTHLTQPFRIFECAEKFGFVTGTARAAHFRKFGETVFHLSNIM